MIWDSDSLFEKACVFFQRAYLSAAGIADGEEGDLSQDS